MQSSVNAAAPTVTDGNRMMLRRMGLNPDIESSMNNAQIEDIVSQYRIRERTLGTEAARTWRQSTIDDLNAGEFLIPPPPPRTAAARSSVVSPIEVTPTVSVDLPVTATTPSTTISQPPGERLILATSADDIDLTQPIMNYA